MSLYDQQVCVNLVNHHGSEGKLEKSFGNMIRLLGDQSIRYESFDFHKQCGADKWDRLSILINRLANDMDSFGYFLATRHGAPLTQRGIFRTNCIDCLDRTNVVQSLLAKRMLHIQLLRLADFTRETNRSNLTRNFTTCFEMASLKSHLTG